MSAERKKPCLSAMNTGHRLVEPWTTPTITVSSRRARHEAAAASAADREPARPVYAAPPWAAPAGDRYHCAIVSAGRAPDAIMPANIVECRVERIDPMRHAADIRMECDRHDPAGFGALAKEHVEGAANQVAEFVGAVTPARKRACRWPAAYRARKRGCHRHRGASDRAGRRCTSRTHTGTLGSEEVERVPGLLQAGTQPASRPRAGNPSDGRKAAPDDQRFLARRRLIEAAGIGFIVPHPLPATLIAFLDDDRMVTQTRLLSATVARMP